MNRVNPFICVLAAVTLTGVGKNSSYNSFNALSVEKSDIIPSLLLGGEKTKKLSSFNQSTRKSSLVSGMEIGMRLPDNHYL